MPRPTTQTELLEASDSGFAALQVLLDSIPADRLGGPFPFPHRDRNVRDVLGHLQEWQSMLQGWYRSGMAGEKPEMPAPGYTWRQTPALNQAIWQRYQTIPLQQVRESLRKSHRSMHRLIAAHDDRELFTRGLYPWTGSATLGSYFASATSSHYRWAIRLLRRFQRSPG